MKTKLISLFIGTLLIIAILPVPLTSAQSDCGNGLTQRLEVGGRGWIDPTPPAQGVRMRQAPGEAEVARLQPGEEFDVLRGPQCFDGLSWWQIDTDSGKRDWIAEGIPGGGADPSEDYFVEPLDVSEESSTTGSSATSSSTSGRVSPLRNTSETCDESQFEVGQIVELTRDTDSIEFYYGHPLIEDGFFSVQEFNSLSAELDSTIFFFEETFMLMSGPHCFSGNNVWQITDVSPEILSSNNREIFSLSYFWVSETSERGDNIRLSDNQSPMTNGYEAKTFTLTQENSAPIISPDQQILFTSGAGGGGGYGPFYWADPSCDDPNNTNPNATGIGSPDIISTYINFCTYLYPFGVNGVSSGYVQKGHITHSQAMSSTSCCKSCCVA